MKIYFEDNYAFNYDNFDDGMVIDANCGTSHCVNRLEAYRYLEKEDGNPHVVYTNFPLALDNKYTWNEELGVPEVYLRHKTNYFDWVRIDKLTDRELRESHNLMKLYLAGEFNN